MAEKLRCGGVARLASPFLSPPDDPPEQLAIAAVHEAACPVDQPHGPAALGRGFPVGAAPDLHVGIEEQTGDVVGRRPSIGGLQDVQNVEQSIQPEPLKRGWPERARTCGRTRSGKPTVEAPGRLPSYLDRRVTDDDERQRLRRRCRAQPDMVATILVGENHVATVGQLVIGNDRRPAIEIERLGVGKTGRGGIQDDGRREEAGEPRCRRSRGRSIGCAGESKAPIDGPSPPVHRAVRRARHSASRRDTHAHSRNCGAGIPVRIPRNRDPPAFLVLRRADRPSRFPVKLGAQHGGRGEDEIFQRHVHGRMK